MSHSFKFAVAAAALVLTACGDDDSDSGREPLPAATVAAREVFFGAENVDEAGHVREDRVIFTWFGVASLAASFKGHVVLLDTYINNGGCPPASDAEPYVATDYPSLAALSPEAVFIGHDHFDHHCQTGTLLDESGAALVGLPTQCEKIGAEAERDIQCIRTLPADSAFGANAELTLFDEDLRITVLRNLHSGTDAQPPCNTGGCEALLYRFEIGDFSLVWNDSNGPIRTLAPDLLQALRDLPASDVQFGAIIGNGFIAQGMRDPVDYAEALRVKELYPLHHDLFGNGTSAGFRAGYDAAFAATGISAHWLQDPDDYLQPIVFDPRDPVWSD